VETYQVLKQQRLAAAQTHSLVWDKNWGVPKQLLDGVELPSKKGLEAVVFCLAS
jgi:hypothetical protein